MVVEWSIVYTQSESENVTTLVGIIWQPIPALLQTSDCQFLKNSRCLRKFEIMVSVTRFILNGIIVAIQVDMSRVK